MDEFDNQLDLEEKFFLTNGAKFQRLFPWLRMLRAFRIAIGLKCLLLGLCGVLLLPVGDTLVQQFAGDASPRSYPTPPYTSVLPTPLSQQMVNQLRAPQPNLPGIVAAELAFAFSPHGNMLNRGWLMVHQSNPLSWSLAAALVLWGLVVFAVFGGAISRITAHEMTGKGNVSLLGSLGFVLRRIHSYLGAPLLTLVGIGLCWLPMVLGGLIGRIPVVGEFLLAVCWVLVMLAGLLLALILLGVALGWPLMFTTISVEASDAFDGLSRSFSYLFNRPWYALFLVVIMSVYGSVLSHFVVYVQEYAIAIGDQSVSVGLGGRSLSEPPLQMIKSWMWLIRHVPMAFGFSFFWVSFTIGYLLLRHSEDGTPFFVMGQDRSVGVDLPLSGIPAAERREMQLHQEEESDA